MVKSLPPVSFSQYFEIFFTLDFFEQVQEIPMGIIKRPDIYGLRVDNLHCIHSGHGLFFFTIFITIICKYLTAKFDLSKEVIAFFNVRLLKMDKRYSNSSFRSFFCVDL